MIPPPRPSEAPVDAVVLAGSINRIALYPGDVPGRKALVELCGRPLIAYVLDALHEARSVGRIVVVGAPDVLAYAGRWAEVEGIPEGGSLIENAWRGLQTARTERALFCNPDQPLLRTHMVDEFMERALAIDADIVSSWVRFEHLGRYEEGEHKFADFGDGRYAHGNLFLVRRDLPQIPGVRQRMDRLYQARKSNFRFAWALGPGLFTKFIGATISGHLPSLENTLRLGGEHFGLRLGGVVCSFPEIVLDIDEPEDYAAAEKYLKMDEAEPVGANTT